MGPRASPSPRPPGRPRPGSARRSSRSPRTGSCARCPGQEEPAGDVGDRGAVGRGPQHVGAPGRSAASPRCQRGGGEVRSMTRSPAITAPDAAARSATGASLTRKPAAPDLHRPAQEARPAERGEDDRPAVGDRRRQRPGGLDAVTAGHLDVEQGDVGPVLARGGDDGVPRGRPRRPPRGPPPDRAGPAGRRGPGTGPRR